MPAKASKSRFDLLLEQLQQNDYPYRYLARPNVRKAMDAQRIEYPADFDERLREENADYARRHGRKGATSGSARPKASRARTTKTSSPRAKLATTPRPTRPTATPKSQTSVPRTPTRRTAKESTPTSKPSARRRSPRAAKPKGTSRANIARLDKANAYAMAADILNHERLKMSTGDEMNRILAQVERLWRQRGAALYATYKKNA